MSWLDGKLLAFDLETTGKDPLEARIVTATTILIDLATGKKDVTEWLSDVDGQEIPPETTAIHGVTTEHAHAHGQPAAEVAAEVDDVIQSSWDHNIPVVGHNVGYDFTVLDAELRRSWPNAPSLIMRKGVLDTFVLDKHFSWRKGSRKLNESTARRIVYARSDRVCEICGYRRATEWHHRKARSQGGLWTPSNGLHLCHEDHAQITDTREEFYAKGWLVKSWQNPTEIPFEHWRLGLVLLDETATYHLQLIEEAM